MLEEQFPSRKGMQTTGGDVGSSWNARLAFGRMQSNNKHKKKQALFLNLFTLKRGAKTNTQREKCVKVCSSRKEGVERVLIPDCLTCYKFSHDSFSLGKKKMMEENDTGTIHR